MSANTAIYQSSIAFVFILSVPVLGERVTLLKVCHAPLLVVALFDVLMTCNFQVVAMIFAISGIVLISLFSENDHAKNDTITQTPLGYIVSGVWCRGPLVLATREP